MTHLHCIQTSGLCSVQLLPQRPHVLFTWGEIDRAMLSLVQILNKWNVEWNVSGWHFTFYLLLHLQNRHSMLTSIISMEVHRMCCDCIYILYVTTYNSPHRYLRWWIFYQSTLCMIHHTIKSNELIQEPVQRQTTRCIPSLSVLEFGLEYWMTSLQST